VVGLGLRLRLVSLATMPSSGSRAYDDNLPLDHRPLDDHGPLNDHWGRLRDINRTLRRFGDHASCEAQKDEWQDYRIAHAPIPSFDYSRRCWMDPAGKNSLGKYSWRGKIRGRSGGRRFGLSSRRPHAVRVRSHRNLS
jgi:hypothetical protein